MIDIEEWLNLENKIVVEKDFCTFCGKKKLGASTEFNEHYCIDCYKINLIAIQEAIEAIKKKKGC